jgi:hypothetical protein
MPTLTESAIQALVPSAEITFIPPASFAASWSSDDLAQLSELRRRAFVWAASLQARIESEQRGRDLPGFQYATFGFIPVTTGWPVRTIEGFTFGVALELEPQGSEPSQEASLFEHLGQKVALVTNRRQFEPHSVANPTIPRPGTGACWAKSRKKAIKPASEGVLTAEHVVAGVTLTSSVGMSDGLSWRLGDRGSCKLDAALIVRVNSVPTNVTILAIQKAPKPGTDVEFNFTGGLKKSKITHTMIHSTYLNDANPMRVFFDQYGAPGDSGALVREQNSGPGVGIYMGDAPIAGTGGKEGLAQALSQAADALEVDISL